jgi:non-heme chloroperoxidase
MLDFTMAMALTASPKATIDLVHAWSETDFRDDLANLPVRTLIIHGTADNTVPIDVSARRAVKFIPHGELIEYEGEPHGLNVTAVETAAAAAGGAGYGILGAYT